MRHSRASSSIAGSVVLETADGGPIDLRKTINFFRFSEEDCRGFWLDDAFVTAVSFNQRTVLVSLRQHGEGAVSVESEGDGEVAPVIARMLGLHHRLSDFQRQARRDPFMKRILEKAGGLRISGNPTVFETMVSAITAQQISTRFAITVITRMIERYGTPVTAHGRRLTGFPLPSALARIRPLSLRRLQYSFRKAEYIIGVARSFLRAPEEERRLHSLDDAAARESLLRFRGIGPTSADWVLGFGMGRTTVFPPGDIGLRRALEKHYFDGERVPDGDIVRWADQWGSMKGYAALYLWAAKRYGID